jgi:hypothetical protein
MSYLVTYLFLGAMFTLLTDALGNFLESKIKFTNKERIFVMIIWPFALFIFVRDFIKAFRNNGY